MKKIYIFLFLLSLIFVACDKNQEIKPSGKTVNIVILTPFGNKQEKLRYQSLLGLKAAKEMKKYLKNGDEVVFNIIDVDTKDMQHNLKNTILKKKPLAMLSFMSSDKTLSMKDELKKYKLPIIVTLATNNDIVDQDNLFIQICIDNHKQSLVAAHYIRDEKFMKYAGIVYNKRSIYSTSLADEFKKLFKKLGGDIDFFIDVSDKDGLKRFENIKKTNTEIIFNSTDSIMTTKMIKLLKKEGSHIEILGADGLYSSMLENNMDNASLYEDIYVIDHFAHDIYPNKQRKKFEKILNKKGFTKSSYAFLAYDGYQLLTYAFETCPKYNKECINAILRDSETIKGISGNFNIIDSKARREVYINKIKNKKLKKEVVIY